jgi:hypothetical protein
VAGGLIGSGTSSAGTTGAGAGGSGTDGSGTSGSGSGTTGSGTVDSTTAGSGTSGSTGDITIGASRSLGTDSGPNYLLVILTLIGIIGVGTASLRAVLAQRSARRVLAA